MFAELNVNRDVQPWYDGGKLILKKKRKKKKTETNYSPISRTQACKPITPRATGWRWSGTLCFCGKSLQNFFCAVLVCNACSSLPGNNHCRLGTSWPAISDIWLGVRTVPVLSVAKLVAAPARSPTGPRSVRTQAGRCGLTDRRSSVKKILSFVCLLMFPFLLEEITGQGMPVECSKLTCSAKVKKSAWFPSSEIDDRSWPLSVIIRVLRGRARLGIGEK